MRSDNSNPGPRAVPPESAIVSEGDRQSPDPSRSRRSLLVAGLGGLAATIAGAFGRPQPAAAAAGSALIIGSETNNAGSANTQLVATSNVVAFKLLQQGPGTALMGYATPASGATRGVYGRSDSPNGYGVQARNAGAAGTGAAIQAIGGNNFGVEGTSASTAGVVGDSLTGNAPGVWGRTDGPHTGVSGTSTGVGIGVSGEGYGASTSGVVGVTLANASTASGVYGSAGGASYAGYFEGNVSVTGTVTTPAVTLRIDHPLEPATKILQHSFVESPDMLNIYNGVVSADAAGEATVELPAWFMALNRDFRYGLTPIGAFAPLFVKAKVAAGRFTIAGAQPGQEISWQLTGIRRDAWANANRNAVELDKPAEQRGQYLHPAAHGQPASAGVDYPMQRRLAAMRDRALAAPPAP